MSMIKITRAARLCFPGRFPKLYEAILDTIGPEVIATLNSSQLGALVDRVYCSWQESKRIAGRECLEMGGVWSDREERIIPLVGYETEPFDPSKTTWVEVM